MSRKALVAAFAWLGVCLAIVLLTGCGGPKEGTVVSKRVEPARDWIWLMPTYSTRCYPSGSRYGGSSCSTYQSGVIPVWQHSPECDQLTLAKDPQNHPRDTGTVCVDQLTYTRTNLGDYYKETK